MLSLSTIPCCLWMVLTALLAVQAMPIYPGYSDFAPIVLPGGYGAGSYPILAGGAYYNSPVQHHVHSAGARYPEHGGYSEKTIDYQKDSKYYYGGQYKGSCLDDGLYYKDDTTFVMCSNGYPHEQACPPGTKTSGSPSYKAGYYYGYTDLCSVNLVDYGLGPEHYAPAAPPEEEKHQHHPRGGSSSAKVSFSRSSYGGAHGAEVHASKDVYSQQNSGSHYGGQHQTQHTHLEKHKTEGHQGAEYNKQVVKQGHVTSYSDLQADGAHHGYGQGPYGGSGHTSHQSIHKEKQVDVGYQSHGYPHGHQERSEHVVKSHVSSSDLGHHGHQEGGYVHVDQRVSSSGAYPHHGQGADQYASLEKVKDRVETSYHGSAPHGSVEKSHQHSHAYAQYGGSQYPQHAGHRPSSYEY